MQSQYVLRPRDKEEIERLRFQHLAWKEETDYLVQACEIEPGDVVVDLGGGPGWMALELALQTGYTGKVFSADTSEAFLKHVELLSESENLPQLKPLEINLLEEWELPVKADVILIRWVIFFLPNAKELLGRIVDQLKPGGRLGLMEYFKFKSMSLFPDGKMFRKVYDAVYDLLVNAGGDPDIGMKIPWMLEHLGMEILMADNIMHAVKTGTAKWEWLARNNPNHTNLLEGNLLQADELEAFYQEWDKHAQDEDAFFTNPPVIRLVARKPLI